MLSKWKWFFKSQHVISSWLIMQSVLEYNKHEIQATKFVWFIKIELTLSVASVDWSATSSSSAYIAK